MEPALKVIQLSSAYRKTLVLENVSFEVSKGTLTGIVGPNGAGKSTLIKTILNLHPPVTGHVSFFGKPYSAMKKKISYVPQRSSVDWDFPTNALDVVMMGLYGDIGWIRWPGRNHRRKAMEALEQMGMADFAARQINQLSGGQKQRVFLARALVQNADLYFMDEPLAGVDAATERKIMDTLKELKREGKTVLVVHHDLQTVKEYFDNVLLLNQTVIAHGKTENVFREPYIGQTYGGKLPFFGRRAEDVLVSP